MSEKRNQGRRRTAAADTGEAAAESRDAAPDDDVPGKSGQDAADPSPTPHPGDTKAEADRWSEINGLVKELIDRDEQRQQQPKDVWYFLSSGVFFMIVGAAALVAAFLTMNTTHASFTFMLVVIGVAILLYGTGTQGAGNFESEAGQIRYKIGVAGGAGLLAFAVAIGIVSKAEGIRDAFQIERKYAKLFFKAYGDGVGSFAGYVPEISIDGMPVRVSRSGDRFEALVPYQAQQKKKKIAIVARFYYVGSEAGRNRLLANLVSYENSFEFDPQSVTTDDAGFDFPRLDTDDLVVTVGANTSGNDPDQIAASQQPVDKKPPPLDSGGFQ